MCAQSCLTLCKCTPRTVACQAPLFMGFLRQEYWSGLPFPSPGDLHKPGIEPKSLKSPTLAGVFFTTSATWKALHNLRDWNAKEESQALPTIIGNFGLGIQNEAGQRLKEFCQGNKFSHSKHLFQHKRRLYIWTSPNDQHQNQTDYILCS